MANSSHISSPAHDELNVVTPQEAVLLWQREAPRTCKTTEIRTMQRGDECYGIAMAAEAAMSSAMLVILMVVDLTIWSTNFMIVWELCRV